MPSPEVLNGGLEILKQKICVSAGRWTYPSCGFTADWMGWCRAKLFHPGCALAAKPIADISESRPCAFYFAPGGFL
jgi:hypothetical protein